MNVSHSPVSRAWNVHVRHCRVANIIMYDMSENAERQKRKELLRRYEI